MTAALFKKKPLMKRLEAAMLSAVRGAGGAAWYVPDDFLTLGPELVPDGTFSSSAGWTLGTGWSITGGKMVVTSAATSSNAIINLGLVSGKNYLVSFDIDSISAGAITPIASSGAAMTQQTAAGWKAGIMVPLGSSGNIGFLSSSATALTAVIDNFSVREVLSAKDFQSASSGLPSFLTGTVGLATEPGATLGPEKLSDPSLINAGSWGFVQPTSGIVEMVAGGGIRLYSADGSIAQAYQTPSLQPEIGKLYRINFEVTDAVSGGLRVDMGGVTGNTFWVPGKYTVHVLATSTVQLALSRATAVATDVMVKNVSVREVSGAAMTQATSGNRPTVSRIPRKLGPELSTFDGTTTGWSSYLSSLSVVGGKLRVTNSGAFGRAGQLLQLVAGKSYQLTATASFVSGTDDNSYLAVSAAIDGAPYASSAQTAAGAKSLVFTATGPLYVRLNSADATDVNDWSGISVREVLEWSYALTFDGSNDSLAAPASIIGSNLSQPYTMIAWGRTSKSDGTEQRIIGDTARWLAINSVGGLSVTNQAAATVSTAGTVAVGASFIAEAVWNGSTVTIWKDGVQDAVAARGAPTGITPSATNIGINGTLSNYFKGDLVGAVVCPAVMTDAQRLAVRKFAAAQMGLTL